MAHSFIEFKGRGFRVNDLDLAVSCFIIIEHAEINDLNELNLMFNEWIDSISSDGAGCINLSLDKYLVTDQHMEYFTYLLSLTSIKMDELKECFPKNKLAWILNQTKINLINDYKVDYIKSTLDGLIKLIKPSDHSGNKITA